jgi:hypothetical protein
MHIWGGKELFSLQWRNVVRFSTQVKYIVLSLFQMGLAWNSEDLNSFPDDKFYCKIDVINSNIMHKLAIQRQILQNYKNRISRTALFITANGRSTIAQILIPRSKVKNMVTELHDGPSGGHLGINKTLNKFRPRFYWLQARADTEKWC